MIKHASGKKSKLITKFSFFLAFGILCYEMGQWITPFIIALVLAYALHVPSEKLVKRLKVSASVSAGIVMLGFIACISMFMIFLIPLLKNATLALMHNLPSIISSLPNHIDAGLKGLALAFGIERTFDVGTIFYNYISSDLVRSLPNHIFSFIDKSVNLVSIIMFVFMTPIVIFYILKDWNKFEKSFKNMSKKLTTPSFEKMLTPINSRLGEYIRGQLVVCVILAILYTIGLFCIGVDKFVVCGITSGILSIVPFFGPVIGLITTLANALHSLASTYHCVSVIALYVVIPLIDSNFITPKFIGKSTGIHPAWLLFSICGCASVFGFSGILISIPMAVVLSTICKEFIKKL